MKYFIKGFVAMALVTGWVSIADAETRKPRAVFRDCPQCPEMVVIPAGSFMMGSPAGDALRYSDEGPRHHVRVKSFAIGKYEVTFAEWDACVAAGGCNGYRPDDSGWGRGRRPVINVNWRDAKAYVSWLSRKTGKRYRLPSESEWEYAARAGTTTPFHFGATIGTDLANYVHWHRMSDGTRKVESRKKTVPVGSFPSNAFGLYDVHGNLWEWVDDCWNGSYGGAPSDGRAWKSGNCSKRVLRGGSWLFRRRFVRSASRWGIDAGYRDYDLGFRVARTF